MDLLKHKEKETLTREAAAARLRQLADQLERHNDVEFDHEGLPVKVKVPAEVHLEFEVEVEDDGGEIEVEISW